MISNVFPEPYLDCQREPVLGGYAVELGLPANLVVDAPRFNGCVVLQAHDTLKTVLHRLGLRREVALRAVLAALGDAHDTLWTSAADKPMLLTRFLVKLLLARRNVSIIVPAAWMNLSKAYGSPLLMPSSAFWTSSQRPCMVHAAWVSRTRLFILPTLPLVPSALGKVSPCCNTRATISSASVLRPMSSSTPANARSTSESFGR